MILTQTNGFKNNKLLTICTCFFISMVVPFYGYSQPVALDVLKKLKLNLVSKTEKVNSINILRNKTEIRDNDGKLNYLRPLINCLSFDISESSNDIKIAYYEQLGNLLSTVGLYNSAIIVNDSTKYYRYYDSSKLTLNQISYYKQIERKEAISIILDSAKKHNVVMLNEAHHIPRHRAFAIALLDSFYRIGFRYLAMETLSSFENMPQIKNINSFTGYYSNEPNMAEFMRYALNVGYELVPYEANISNLSSMGSRDSIEAENIYKIIKKDSAAKIFVYAGYGHIEEISFPEFAPMAAILKRISSIDPLTIDQVKLSYSYFPNKEKEIFDIIDSTIQLKKPSILIYDKKTKINNLGFYDMHIMHPKDTNDDTRRPDWLFLWNKKNKVEIMNNLISEPFLLIQAYFTKDIKDNEIDFSIPADQCISLQKGKSILALQKGNYTVVFRNKNYKILKRKIIIVK